MGIEEAKEMLRQTNGQILGEDIPFGKFLEILVQKPKLVLRSIFQFFDDMIRFFLGEGVDEYPNDPESIGYVFYNCRNLFVKGADHPFFADRLFANRLVSLAKALRKGNQQNKVYIFEGPHGSGKSTFFNNLLRKMEEYANLTEEGLRYKAVWRIPKSAWSGSGGLLEENRLIQEIYASVVKSGKENDEFSCLGLSGKEYLEVACPSNDNPILIIPKVYRRKILGKLFRKSPFIKDIFRKKEYGWLFKDESCTICQAIYQFLLKKMEDPLEVLMMCLYASRFRFNRRLGEGISVFSPGDKPAKKEIMENPVLQKQIDRVSGSSNAIPYLYSQFARVNNGIYALMDIKSHNAERLVELHNLISEGVHKVEHIEENVGSLFLATINPEDKGDIEKNKAFMDRIEYVKIPYVMDLGTEVEIYRNIFGRSIDRDFLPRVLNNFARTIISTRLNEKSEALVEWIGDPNKYSLYCDNNLWLLKMEIYRGHIPTWLTEEDRKRLDRKRRREIIDESENEGNKGISGRDSIKFFSQFHSIYRQKFPLITMTHLIEFLKKETPAKVEKIDDEFLDSLLRMYNYTVLEEVKECLFYYNLEQIEKEIQNYLFAINFEIGVKTICSYTGEKLEISEGFLTKIEEEFLGKKVRNAEQLAFRVEIQKSYTNQCLREINLEGKKITETKLFKILLDRYIYHRKESVLEPFLRSANFARAIKDFGGDNFKAYDKRIRGDVSFLIQNLIKRGYTELGAKEVCLYVLNNDLPQKFK